MWNHRSMQKWFCVVAHCYIFLILFQVVLYISQKLLVMETKYNMMENTQRHTQFCYNDLDLQLMLGFGHNCSGLY